MINYLINSQVEIGSLLEKKNEQGFVEFVIPFSSSRKRATSVVKLQNGKFSVFCKGAPEIVIQRCDKIIGENGEVLPLNQNKKDEILNTIVK